MLAYVEASIVPKRNAKDGPLPHPQVDHNVKKKDKEDFNSTTLADAMLKVIETPAFPLLIIK